MAKARDEYLNILRAHLDTQWNALLDAGNDRIVAYQKLWEAIAETGRKK